MEQEPSGDRPAVEEALQGTAPGAQSESQHLTVRQRRRSLFEVFAGLLPSRRIVTVGVHVGPHSVYLAKVQTGHTGKSALLETREVALSDGVRPGDDRFVGVLLPELVTFCGSASKVELWACLESPQANARRVLVPKTAGKKLPSAVFWLFKKEEPFEESETIFDFQVEGDTTDDGVTKSVVMACTAPREEVEALQTAFAQCGYPLTGMTLPLFAYRNLFAADWVKEAPGGTVVFSVGHDHSQISVYSEHGTPVATRTVKTGMETLLEVLMDSMPGITDEAHAKTILNSLGTVRPELDATSLQRHDSTENVLEVIRPALIRLVRNVERTSRYYSLNLHDQGVQAAYIAGEITQYPPLVEFIAQQLGVRMDTLTPGTPDTENRNGSATASLAVAVALSETSSPPNLLYTYLDEEKTKGNLVVNKALFVGFLALVLVAGGTHFWLARQVRALKKAAEQQSEPLPAEDLGTVSRDRILAAVAELRNTSERMERSAAEYLGVAALHDLLALTPEGIRYTEIELNLGGRRVILTPKPEAKKEGAEDQKTQKRAQDQADKEKEDLFATVRGIVVGSPEIAQEELLRLILALGQADHFGDPTVLEARQQEYEARFVSGFGGERILTHFTLRIPLHIQREQKGTSENGQKTAKE